MEPSTFPVKALGTVRRTLEGVRAQAADGHMVLRRPTWSR